MKAFSVPFQTLNGGISCTDSYEEIVRNQLIDALMTNYRQRVMRPEYGSDILALLFEPSNDLVRSDAASVVKQRLTAMVPRTRIIDVIVDQPEFNASIVNITVHYATRYIEDSLVIEIPLEEGVDNG